MTERTLHAALTAITNNQSPEIVSKDDHGHYYIAGADKLAEQIKAATDIAQKTTFTDDDRKEIKSVRAYANKLNKAITQAVKDEKETVFAELDNQAKHVKNQLSHFDTTLKTTLDTFDQKRRAEIRTDFETALQDMIDFDSDAADEQLGIDNLKLEDVENTAWYNRSSSQTKAIKELENRFQTIIVLHKTNPELNLNQLTDLLKDCQFNTAHALDLINKEKEQTKQAQQRQEQYKNSEQEAQDQKHTEVSLTFTVAQDKAHELGEKITRLIADYQGELETFTMNKPRQ